MALLIPPISTHHHSKIDSQGLKLYLNVYAKKFKTQVPSHNLCSNAESNPREECQAITLRSGKELKETSKKPQEKNSNEGEEERDKVQVPTPNS
ncbi:hypothetical protein AHAS_Ahas15G0251900 [Arachis hypogaea]